LTQFEIAAALAYTLTAWPPTTALYEAASQGLLATPEQVAAQTTLLMGFEGQAPPALSNFLREYFRSRGLEKVFKNNADLNTDNRAALIEDFDTLITDIVASSATKDFFSAVLTTKKVRYRTQTAALYGQNDPHERVSFSTAMLENRAGLLTHPAWLASLSSDTETHPVARGKFISESFLCRPLPPLPVGMIPVLSDDPKRTMREKLAIHGADPKCAACHQFMDPLGLVFEAYDQNGRPRTIDKGGKAVDSTGALSGAGQQDGPLTGPVDLAQRLAASPVVQECMVRHSFRYWMGHDEAPYDGCTLAAAKTAYDANGGSYIHLVASLFSSRSFLNRSTR